jgi:hypothetical protein
MLKNTIIDIICFILAYCIGISIISHFTTNVNAYYLGGMWIGMAYSIIRYSEN